MKATAPTPADNARVSLVGSCSATTEEVFRRKAVLGVRPSCRRNSTAVVAFDESSSDRGMLSILAVLCRSFAKSTGYRYAMEVFFRVWSMTVFTSPDRKSQGNAVHIS